MRKSKNYWTKERCQKEALKYTKRGDFSSNCGGAYNASNKNGWLDEICSHMKLHKKPSNYWTKERCREEVSKYKTRNYLRLNSGGAYDSMLRNGWLDELICSLEPKHKPLNYWTKEMCEKEISKYDNMKDVRENCVNIYRIICQKGWRKELCSHITYHKKPTNYWNKERCRKEASKYKTRTSFHRHSISAYIPSNKNGWLDEFFPK